MGYLSAGEQARWAEIKAMGLKGILCCPHCTLRVEVRNVGLVHLNGKRECREGGPYVAENPRVVAK